MAAPSAGRCGFRRSAMAARAWWAVGCGRWLSTVPTAAAAAPPPRPWKLFGALCLLRLPRITQPLQKEEEEMAALMEQIELERSHYSDHEILVMAQDLEEKWEQKLLRFSPAPRVTGDHIQAKILGNAPYGIYKYKFPRAIRTEDNVGAKVFFYKAFLQSSDLSQAELKKDYLWVTKDELGDYLKSEYLKKVNRFLLDL
ncbi:39S ribosomal protein L46, mitochondrial [Numida meleagris]|uniref:39S ribosomal protein L46, mitochondrial n=1 Tax=Numida meleagris TaxID=8996 RepID=UPI000B3D9CBD|nr:39S ribosomal protein L46, mitochondrial [Numida meleagris]